MPAYKGSKVLGTLRGGFHPRGTAPVAGMIGTRGPRTTDPDMVGRRTMGRAEGEDIDPRNNGYVRATSSKDVEKRRSRNRNAEGGSVKKMAKGGSVSKRADGCAKKGKTRGKMV